MKTSEIVKNLDDNTLGWKAERELLFKYYYDDCIVGYSKNFLGEVFFIKGKIKFFCFLYHAENTIQLDGARTLRRLDLDDMNKSYKAIETSGKILDQKLWEKLGAILFTESL